MRPDVRTKWLEALRGGGYAQGRGQLRGKDDSYCCIGVLCDVLDPEGWKPEPNLWTWRGTFGFIRHQNAMEIGLPHEIESRLIHMNDKDKLSFAQIADYIEATL